MVPTVGAFDTHLFAKCGKEWNLNRITKKAKNIHNCSVAVKFNLYKSSNKKLPAFDTNKQKQPT
jgi:hypothetical protein